MAAQTDSKVPEIRFKGFEAEWEENTLGELTPLRGGFAFESSQYRATGIPIVKISNVLSSGDVGGAFAFYDEQDNDQNYSLPNNAALLAMSGATTGKVSILKKPQSKKVYQNQRVGYFEDLKNVDYRFISTIVRSSFFTNQLDSVLVAGAQPNVSSKEINSFEFKIPKNKPEQTQIGAYFKELDRMLGLYQRKHDKLVTLKQAMLQKMFPQDGATTPEIHFKGFEGDWVEKRLGDICEIVGGGTPSTSIPEYWGGDIDWYSPTEIGSEVYAFTSVKRITQLGLGKCSATILPANKTVLFTSRAGIGDMAILRKDGATNQGFQSFILHNGIDPYFIYSMGYLIKNFAMKHASGSTFLEISSKQLVKMEILLPKSSEQQKIGTYFRKLDALISQHAIQLTKLKQIKSACLEKMFV